MAVQHNAEKSAHSPRLLVQVRDALGFMHCSKRINASR